MRRSPRPRLAAGARPALVAAAAALLLACSNPFDPASYVQGLRVLAVKSEPAEAAPGDAVTLTALTVDTDGAAVDVAWSACTLPPLAAAGPINPDCFRQDTAPYLLPLGEGASISSAVPAVVPADFGPPDAGGGLYLPVRARARASGERLDAAYPLRLAQGEPPNHNPQLLGIQVAGVESAPGTAPIEVRAGDHVTLSAPFAPGSAEEYPLAAGGQSGTVTEILRVSWFATGGSFSEDVTGGTKLDTDWRADKHLPPTGGTVDLWAVGRDERGGVDWVHRTLVVR
jgi:hypothetical protein